MTCDPLPSHFSSVGALADSESTNQSQPIMFDTDSADALLSASAAIR